MSNNPFEGANLVDETIPVERDARLELMMRNLEGALTAYEAKDQAQIPHRSELESVFAPFLEIGKLPDPKKLARLEEVRNEIQRAKKIFGITQAEQHLLLWLNNLLVEIEAQANDREVASWNTGKVASALERLEKIAFVNKWAAHTS